MAALPTFQSQTNAVATNVYNNAVEADTDAVAAAASALAAANSASAASASAQAAALASSVDEWVSGQSYPAGDAVFSPITFLTYRRTASSPGSSTTDPSVDTTRWQLISGSVTSVAMSGGTTGLTISGGPVSTTGTFTLAGTLAAANGGTGLASPGASGNVLVSDGTGWVSQAPAGGAPDFMVQAFGIV